MKNKKICLVGLGYVGLPLAVEFGKIRNVVGYDIDKNRIKELQNGLDTTLEISNDELKESTYLEFTSSLKDIVDCSIYIITVPTPINNKNEPDLDPLARASELVGSLLKQNDIVIYESTVYPGATEEYCVPILEAESSLKFNVDFFCGYSPERINPGDKEHRLTSILKVTSGSTDEIAREVDSLYGEIITAGTYMAENIKVAEAAKVIENTQRDVNIALINELSIVFNLLEIDTESVLKAAGTKWNFLPFRPGLVGGHCISVDPYYLTHKSIEVGYSPEVILSGRKLNDNMGSYISNQIVKLMKSKNIKVFGSRILLMGLTFKENCPDLRNTRVVDIMKSFGDFNCEIDVYDPWVDSKVAQKEYNIGLVDTPSIGFYDGIILAVAHDRFIDLGIDKIKSYGKLNHIIYDVKHLFSIDQTDGRL